LHLNGLRVSRRGLLAGAAVGGGLLVAWALLPGPGLASACEATPTATAADLDRIQAYLREQRREVLTFVGYSGAGYEDPDAMLEHARAVLLQFSPDRTLVNIGATAEGIGAVYELAKGLGFRTMGIVSALARDEKAVLSTCVDDVFFVPDTSWGGRLPGSSQLSPTSSAIVAASSVIFGIGGGGVARDEMAAARQAGKRVTFIPADMNHARATEAALRKGEPPPTDFRGAAHSASVPGS